MPNMPAAAPATRLGDWLLEEGYLNEAQLDLALREQRRGGKLLGEALLELGFVSQEVLSRFLARKTQTETISVRLLNVPPEVLALVPEDLARRLVALPVSREADLLTVAIGDPLNVTAFDLLEQTTGLRVNLVAAAASEVLQAIEGLYKSGQTVDQLVDELLELGGEQLASATEKDAPTIRLVDRIIHEAISSGASDIHVHPEEKILRIRLRRDGVLNGGYLVPKPIQPALTARFKILGGMDIAESRRTQSGRGSLLVGGREVGLRFSSLPTAFGESLVIRILDRRSISLDLAELGFDPELETGFRTLLDRPHGVILVTGPTGSGKTTTLYTALGLINGAENSIFTLEDPVEHQLPLVRQTQINETVDLTFAEGLRTLLRQDPDVILVGETRDTETAQLMVRAALTGHLVFSTLHTNDALGAVPRLVDLGVPAYLLAPTLIGVLAQRLVRRLCVRCREPLADPAAHLAAMKLPVPDADLSGLCQPVGCSHCRGLGFRGRLAIHELLVIDGSFQAAITANANTATLDDLARKNGCRTMLEDGLAKALQGTTTVEEVVRATGL
jgi:type II secretory ATPase GspE/PulE/Tfp pilus assembly ATPase PilB-like protein